MNRLTIGAVLLILATGCGKTEDPADPSSTGGGGGNGGSNSTSASDDGSRPVDDITKPFLSEKRVGNLVAAMKDPETPFEAVQGATAFNAESKMKEFDAASRKHGFKDGQEFLDVWMRWNGVSTMVAIEDQNQAMLQGQKDSIKAAEEALKKPDLTPEMRKMFEGQIAQGKATIEAMSQPREGDAMNEDDIAMFRKHRAALEEAVNARKK